MFYVRICPEMTIMILIPTSLSLSLFQHLWNASFCWPGWKWWFILLIIFQTKPFSFHVFCLDCTVMISNLILTSHFFAFVFQYLNIKLTDISVTDPEKYPHMVGLNFLQCFHKFSFVAWNVERFPPKHLYPLWAMSQLLWDFEWWSSNPLHCLVF